MNDLHDVEKEPEFLIGNGYARREEETTESVRLVWYEKTFGSFESNLRFVIQIEFELSISDAPYASWTENCTYCFNGVYLVVIDRQMRRWDNVTYEEDTECPGRIGRYKLEIHTMSRLRSLCSVLGEETMEEI